ncbi:uncharacterized protein LOC128954002 [Oppia nitens]|uniref:uncharacterized protein LOC128954002 n=1 Tax=Oppia nitens TaxID=1686743 RepID=UPI0023D9F93E|nr:uncharacterized protein LOC128954002 [Oppia nitens]
MFSNMKNSLLLFVPLMLITLSLSSVTSDTNNETIVTNSNAETVDICQHKDIEINEAFYLISKKQLNIYPKDSQYYYRVHGFEYNRNDSSFKFQSIDKVNDKNKFWELQEMRLLFTIDYPIDNKRQQRILWMGLSVRDEIPNKQMVSYLYNYDGDTITSKAPININYYKYKPQEEPLNLQSILAKFPSEQLFDHLLSITSFPHSPDLPNRLIVYYKETPQKSKQNECVGCYRSKRYIFVESVVDYKEYKESDWNHDNTSTTHPCTDLNGRIVNASMPLTDYLSDNDSHQFDWIEFFGDRFHVNRMFVTKNKGYKVVDKRSEGYIIYDIFGCKGRPIDPITEQTTTGSDTITGHNSDPNKPQNSGSESKEGDKDSKWSVWSSPKISKEKSPSIEEPIATA